MSQYFDPETKTLRLPKNVKAKVESGSIPLRMVLDEKYEQILAQQKARKSIESDEDEQTRIVLAPGQVWDTLNGHAYIDYIDSHNQRVYVRYGTFSLFDNTWTTYTQNQYQENRRLLRCGFDTKDVFLQKIKSLITEGLTDHIIAEGQIRHSVITESGKIHAIYIQHIKDPNRAFTIQPCEGFYVPRYANSREVSICYLSDSVRNLTSHREILMWYPHLVSTKEECDDLLKRIYAQVDAALLKSKTI